MSVHFSNLYGIFKNSSYHVSKEISNLLMARIRSNYRSIMSFNTALIALGVVGVILPTTSAFLHNASTLAFTLKSMTKLM